MLRRSLTGIYNTFESLDVTLESTRERNQCPSVSGALASLNPREKTRKASEHVDVPIYTRPEAVEERLPRWCTIPITSQ